MDEKPETCLVLAQAIAEVLGDEWTAYTAQRNRAQLYRDGTPRVWLRGDGYDWRGSKRVLVSGHYPGYKGRYVCHGGVPPEITCAIARGPRAIARDIERRFLPRYWERVESIEVIVAKYTAGNAEVRAAATALAAVTGGQVRDAEPSHGHLSVTPKVYFNVSKMRVRVGVHGDVCSFEIQDVTHSQALALAKILVGEMGDELREE